MVIKYQNIAHLFIQFGLRFLIANSLINLKVSTVCLVNQMYIINFEKIDDKNDASKYDGKKNKKEL